MTPTDALPEPLRLVVALGLLGLLPFAFMTLTSFVKISTVLHIARSAIGAQSVPTTTVIMALSTALTLLVMAPVGTAIASGLEPVLQADVPTGQMLSQLWSAVAEPLRTFLSNNASAEETQRFLALARRAAPDQAELKTAADFAVVIPAFLVTELGEAFALGFAIFLPFLVIDMIVGNVLLALGMQMMSPTQVSLPFKLLLFVMADGWGLLAQSLIAGYQ